MYVYVYVCIYVCMYICMYVYMYVCVYIDFPLSGFWWRVFVFAILGLLTVLCVQACKRFQALDWLLTAYKYIIGFQN